MHVCAFLKKTKKVAKKKILKTPCERMVACVYTAPKFSYFQKFLVELKQKASTVIETCRGRAQTIPKSFKYYKNSHNENVLAGVKKQRSSSYGNLFYLHQLIATEKCSLNQRFFLLWNSSPCVIIVPLWREYVFSQRLTPHTWEDDCFTWLLFSQTSCHLSKINRWSLEVFSDRLSPAQGTNVPLDYFYWTDCLFSEGTWPTSLYCFLR